MATLYELNGVSKPLSYWCKEFSIQQQTVRGRLSRGYALENALKEREILPSKTEGEWFLNDVPKENLPKVVKHWIDISGANPMKPGQWFRRNFTKEFDKWYKNEFIKLSHDAITSLKGPPKDAGVSEVHQGPVDNFVKPIRGPARNTYRGHLDAKG